MSTTMTMTQEKATTQTKTATTLPSLQLVAQPLTHESWAPYGDVIQGSNDPSTMPKHVITNTITANPEIGHKFNRISPITSLYPTSPSTPSYQGKPHTAINVIRVGPPKGLTLDGTCQFQVRMLERHAATSQAFIPMNKSTKDWDEFAQGDEAKRERLQQTKEAGGMLVVGCLSQPDGQPELSTLKVFVARPDQGVCYHAGIWHHSLVSFTRSDIASVDTQITTDGSLLIDLEIVRRQPEQQPFALVQLPKIV
ncbi:Allantoicase [Microbotryomycetes sp. JL221]|nr:Allantoicase [Microbotryomycetes sp. JL221]